MLIFLSRQLLPLHISGNSQLLHFERQFLGAKSKRMRQRFHKERYLRPSPIGDSLWNLALILTSHMERKSQEAELNKTEDQMRNLGWDDLRFKRPGFFFRPGKAKLPKEMERFEKINLALHRLLGPLGRQEDFENEGADPQDR
jgi:hypothetical protein